MARTALALAVLAWACSSARADELDDFRAREQIAAQKWTREVGAALETSRRLERSDPTAARDTAQTALEELRKAPALNEALRRDLTRRLEARLAEITRAPVARSGAAAPPGSRPAAAAAAPA